MSTEVSGRASLGAQGNLIIETFVRRLFQGRGLIFMAPIGPITPTVTEFEQVVREYKLSPDQYLRSTRLREWARRNKNSKYIPEPLLEAWGFEIESTL